MLAWVLGGAVANFFMVISLSKELEDFPGGPEMLSRVLGPSIEAFRPLRWPAERLDTLGGYVTYHNMILITMFLAVYAVVQGAKSVRGGESRGTVEMWLSAGISRRQIVITRALSFALILAVIAAGIAAGTALALALVGKPDTGGAFVTLLAAWCAALVGFGFGLLVSQFFGSAKLAAGVGSTALIVLYVLGNSAEKLGPFGFLQFLSPFTYSNLSRALVPGIQPNWASMGGLLLVGAALIAVSTWIFQHRDLGSVFPARRARRAPRKRPRGITVTSLWGDAFVHGWVAIATWAASAAVLTAVMVSLEPAAMTAWEYFDVLLPAAPGAVTEREAQYLGLSSSLMIPFIAGYVVSQSAKWSADFSSGRTGLILAAPVSWTRLLGVRIAIALFGTASIVVASLLAMVLTAAGIGITVDPAGLGRLTVVALALGLAMSALSALTTALFRHRSAVLGLSVYLGVAYLLTFIVPMLDWPEWINRLSVFTAFGNPYLEWPGLAESMVIVALSVPGLLLAFVVTARSPKAP